MQTLSKILAKLPEIKNMGYVKSSRGHNTGVGKTLEDLLGIEENNIPGPDGLDVELKSARKNSKSLLTFFTKAPTLPTANSLLLKTFSYQNANGFPELHATLDTDEYLVLKSGGSLKVEVQGDEIHLVGKTSREATYGIWTSEILKERFQKKIPRLLYVKADTRRNGGDEEFWYNEAWLYSEFDYEKFAQLMKLGAVKVDIRIGWDSKKNRPHDRGTGFRIDPRKLGQCFRRAERVL